MWSKPSHQMSTVATAEISPEQFIIYWSVPLWNTSFVHAVLQELLFSSSPKEQESLLNMDDNLSTLGTVWVAEISSYRWTKPTPYINGKKFCTCLHTKMILQFSEFSFDSSHIAGNIQEQFPQQGSAFLQYNSIWRPSTLFTHCLIIPQFRYLQASIQKNRFCTLFWDSHVMSGLVCLAWLEIRAETPVQDMKSMNPHRQYLNREQLKGNSHCLF